MCLVIEVDLLFMKQEISCLLIDDDADDREIFEIALKEIFYNSKFYGVPGGIEAIDLIESDKNFRPDFIFMDLNMPMMGGIECFHELKKIPYLKHSSIIFYTTSSHDRDITKAKELGSNHFLTKPSRIGDLSKILSELFKGNQNKYYLNELLK